MNNFKIFCYLYILSNTILSSGESKIFLGQEYQKAGGSIRTGDPASDAAFASWLSTANLTIADVSSSLASSPKAVWGKFTNNISKQEDYTYTIGISSVTASISGWNNLTGSRSVSVNASLSTFGLNGSTMQASAPRPLFASGAGSGYYLGTEGGSTTDNIRNGVFFDLSNFTGGGVYSFGIFGGDLETGGPSGSPQGFLQLTFIDDTTTIINYSPDSSLIGGAQFTGNNNVSSTYGNETSRFIGFSTNEKLVKSALFVVGDDDINDDGDSEQLSFIGSGITFLDSQGNPVIPNNIPEPAITCLAFASMLYGLLMRRR